MALPITTLYAVLLGVIFAYLGFRIGSLRGKTGISILDGGNPQVGLEMRRHGNFAESVPFALILMALVEAGGGNTTALHVIGVVLVVARILHPIGLEADSIQNPLRAVGAGGSILCTFALMVMGVMTLL